MKKSIDSNIIYASYDELISLGYEQLKVLKDKKGNIIPPPPGCLVCLTNKDKDMWAESSEIDIKYSKVNAEKQLILIKP